MEKERNRRNVALRFSIRTTFTMFLMVFFSMATAHTSIVRDVHQFLIAHYECLDLRVSQENQDKEEAELLIKDNHNNSFYLFSSKNSQFSLRPILKDYAFLAAHRALKKFTDLHLRDEYVKKASKFLGVDENIFVLQDSVE
ncbi:hypothetical protein A7K93_02500 [Candidatus Methylacidiphilum fumarolicum]|uniref:Uncharacterized protein n=2 Tax=Candidatus Methylacidiphilum fumarolicum TaxID=591154 RepID=I0JVH8_METFB|nr:hypothetical protein [Candidatus Methylacidiphilum fumarolicum]MBW6414852.1 hypothetical protein [Candidatus Methylacidiphilum fumarolicum]TFE68292.1 hypothetical protein A7K73_00705 [Candidatus Methylacidiphilum fumarolicum]TFE73520.1 hypothetical protein A7K72_06345 [Candidatus Methylacidiphilum fumarolicum]TFE75019.1 hypothetical protein A7K93_02500 [Candidatus Methylacidiphilum fumarolicum]TFE76565.1 hypothetical protein A7D33_09505 [Candidatus Methylacidiphilum fumarolicum]